VKSQIIPANASLVLVLALILRSGFGHAECRAEDWPRFLGPRGDNTSTETGLLDMWPTNGLLLLWDRKVGSGYSAPSVLGTNLVLHHRLKDEEIIECFDAATGRAVWRHSDASTFSDPFGYNNGPRATPLLEGDHCYTYGAEGRLVCLQVETGKLVWQRETAKEWSVPEPFFGVGSSPLLESGKLIVMVGGQPNSTIVALDPHTGKTLWENVGRTNWQGVTTIGWRGEGPYQWTGEEKLASYSTPVAATIHGRRQVFCLTRQGLVSLNPTNGSVNFARWFQAPVNESVNAMCPVVWNELVLISGAYSRVGSVLLRVRPDGRSFDEVWRSPAQRLERDRTGGGLVEPVLEAHWTTPVAHNGYLYAFSGRNEPDATFRCVEFQTGKLMWSRDERWRSHSLTQPPVYGRGAAILADAKLIVLGEGGRLGLFLPNPKEPREICAWQVPQLQYPCWTGPVLSRQRLYLRSEDRLLCFALGRRESMPR
jgi:outer membrane protein assembly factor BamB